MEKDNNIDIKEFLDMFDDDGNIIRSIDSVEKKESLSIVFHIHGKFELHILYL